MPKFEPTLQSLKKVAKEFHGFIISEGVDLFGDESYEVYKRGRLLGSARNKNELETLLATLLSKEAEAV
ncbi:MAG: hypothetical protein IBX45_12435 [Campylobacterales bacterium]|nr:hypothetical protein [Campylobacterales bacterium]